MRTAVATFSQKKKLWRMYTRANGAPTTVLFARDAAHVVLHAAPSRRHPPLVSRTRSIRSTTTFSMRHAATVEINGSSLDSR